MNSPTPDFLLARESTLIGTDIAALLDDQQLSVAVTYKEYTGRTFTPTTGATTNAYTSTALRAVRTSLSARELAAGAGVYQAGDVKFTFARSDLTWTPQLQDRIVEDGVTYSLVNWQTDILSMLWIVVARRGP